MPYIKRQDTNNGMRLWNIEMPWRNVRITFFLAELFFAYYNRAHREKQYFLQKETMIMANTNPVVTFTMENGDVMKAELYPEIAQR